MAENKYSSSPDWVDITPIPLDDGSKDGEGPAPLASIAYPSAYAEATAYLRAVMAKNEMSERALKLTTDVIMMNPAHYTVWYVDFCPVNVFSSDLVPPGSIGPKFCLCSVKTSQRNLHG